MSEPEISVVMTDQGPMIQVAYEHGCWAQKIRRNPHACRLHVAALEAAIRAAEAMGEMEPTPGESES